MNTFMVTEPNHPYKIEVRWLETERKNSGEFYPKGRKDWFLFLQDLEDLRGVERVNLHRYAMEIFYAAHVTDAKELGTKVRELLREHVQDGVEVI